MGKNSTRVNRDIDYILNKLDEIFKIFLGYHYLKKFIIVLSDSTT